MTNLVLIPCCAKKRPGGASNFDQPSRLKDGLSGASYRRLLSARRELASILNCAPGPDLGFDHQHSDVEYLPAYKRYIGLICSESHLEELYPRSNLKILIVSALYGLVDADDLIRIYDLTMMDKINGSKVLRFWQELRLGEILCEYVHNTAPASVYHLLTENYRKAARPWPRCPDITSHIIKPDFPGRGFDVLRQRGKYLKKLLEGERRG